MSSGFYKKILLSFLAAVLILSGFYCKDAPEGRKSGAETSEWNNVYDTSVHYVGMQACKSCHFEVFENFMQTGMGQSFDHASLKKSAADFGKHALVYDRDLDFYYHPFWQNDSLYLQEYRLEGKDTVHKLIQKIDYIIGSGQHTNSHIFSVNGYLYQAPVTFYTQKRQWDLAPGFEKGASSRFTRIIQNECMTCHNGYSEFIPNSQNKFLSLKTGIDCERCHGPGSLHVAEKMAGKLVDTSKTPDYTIVNPRRLSTELQNNVCMRCHLQGIAVLNDGKDFFDFRPGMKLSEVMNVFMPEYEGAEDKMIMASHVERMKKSPCYINSGKMSCITCHNPHVSIKFTPRTQYINACQGCHGGKGQIHCSEDKMVRAKKNDDCVTCHMAHNGSIDIPHVAVTDHYIRKHPVNNLEQDKIRAFLGLKPFNNDHPDAISKGRAYMEFFERYNPNAGLLDSAFFYLNQEKQKEASEKQNRDFIRLYFLRNDFRKVIEYAAPLKPSEIQDAWTSYRIGESYFQLQQPQQALDWYRRTVEIKKYGLDFQNKYGTCLLALGNLNEAYTVFGFILNENPDHVAAQTNMGYILMQQGENGRAYQHIKKAQQLDPDYEQNLINFAVWYYNNQQKKLAKKTLEHLIKKHPGNVQAKAMLEDLKQDL